jgi:hypothetical protein
MDKLKEVKIIEAFENAWDTFLNKAYNGEFGELEIKQANDFIEFLKTVDIEILSNRKFLRISWHVPLFMANQSEKIPEKMATTFIEIYCEIGTELQRLYEDRAEVLEPKKIDNLKEVKTFEALDKVWNILIDRVYYRKFGKLEIKQANNFIKFLKTLDSEMLSNPELLRLTWGLPSYINGLSDRVPKEYLIEYERIQAEILNEIERIYGKIYGKIQYENT